jgi:hypothetical protein
MKGLRRGVTTVYITEATALFLGENNMANPTYSPNPVPKYKQTTDK